MITTPLARPSTVVEPVTARRAERAQLLPFALAVGFVMATMASRSNAIAALVTVGAVLVAVGRILVTGRMDRISWAASAYLGWQLLFGMAVGAGPAHASDLGRFVSYDGSHERLLDGREWPIDAAHLERCHEHIVPGMCAPRKG